MSIQQTPPDPEFLLFLQKAYNAGELTFKRALKYRNKKGTHLAPLGYIFYKIRYVTDDKIVYDGAYRMTIALENKLLQKEHQLQAYLCVQLAPKIMATIDQGTVEAEHENNGTTDCSTAE